MAGDWIKFEKATLDKPEVYEMAGILGIDPDAVIGKLLRVWDWFDDQSLDGYAPVTLAAQLNRNTGYAGFTEAMKQVGWMIQEGSKISIPNFQRHNGETAKQRALSAKRMAKKRSKSDDGSVTSSVTSSQPEKRREEKINKESLPLPFLSDGFKTAWEDWLKYQKQKKKKMTELTIKSQFKKFKEWGEAKSILAIEDAIANGWQGVFEPKIDPTMKASVISKDNQGCMSRNFTSADVGI